MHSADFEQFRTAIEDLCTAFDRPCTDARVRVFWEALKAKNLLEVQRGVQSAIRNLKRMPSPADLMPEKARQTVAQATAALPEMSGYAIAANRILFALAYQDNRRSGSLGAELLAKAMRVKADYVHIAESAVADGDPMPTIDFNRMCIEGFERLLGTGTGVTP